MSIRSDFQRLLSKQEITFDNLDLASRKMLQQVTTGFNDVAASIQDTIGQILDRVDDKFSAQADAQFWLKDQAEFEQHREQCRWRLLASLKYSEMRLHISSISNHSEGTFAWILDSTCESSKGSFASWLLSPEPHL